MAQLLRETVAVEDQRSRRVRLESSTGQQINFKGTKPVFLVDAGESSAMLLVHTVPRA
jgi:hypothetical protein